jgi:hypothetical protein
VGIRKPARRHGATFNRSEKEIEMSANRLFIPFVTIALLSLIAIRSIGLAVLPSTAASGNFVTTSTTIKSVTEDKFAMAAPISWERRPLPDW